MKYFLATFIFLFTQTALFSQSSISGVIVDSSQVPIPFAVVALLNYEDSAIVKGIPTDETGTYVFDNLHPGNYLLKASATGFIEKYSEEIQFDSIHPLTEENVSLLPSLILNEVTVSAIRPTFEFKNGNITVNVENSALAKGNTVYELLQKLPGVSIENNEISMQGKSGVIVMIDGRVQQMSNQQLMNILKGMSAENIQKIELLKNPPVKYDAAGTSGMINIVTKKNEQVGFSGNVYSETSQGFYNNASSGIALNYKNQKVSIFSGVDGIYNTYLVNTKLFTNYTSDSGSTNLANKTGYRALEAGLTFKLGADWYPNKSNTVGFKIDGGPGLYNEVGNGSNYVSGYNNTGFDHLHFVEDGHNNWNTQNYNLNAEHQFDSTGTVLDFSADYVLMKEIDRSFYSNYFYDANNTNVLLPNIYQNENNSNSKIFSSKFDFVHPIDTTSSFEAGIKGSFTNMINEYFFERKNPVTSLFYNDTNLSNTYSYSEENFAIYFNYSKSFRFLRLQAGMRAEKTSVNGTSVVNTIKFSKNYASLFPNLSCEYSRSDKHVFQLNLNRRIDRPSYWDLTPFVVYRDQYSYFSGNPYLQPEYSNTAEITYVFQKFFTNSISCSRVKDFMLDYTEQNDSTRILLETSKNIPHRDALAYLIFVQYDFTKWYEVSFNANVTYLGYKGDIKGVPFHTKGMNYILNLTNTLLLPEKIKLEISGLYRGPNLFGITAIDPLWTASFAFQKSFFKEKVDCTVGFFDIFNTFKFHTHAQFDNQNWNFYQTSDPRRISLSISYNFGKVKADEREINSNEEEKDRLNH